MGYDLAFNRALKIKEIKENIPEVKIELVDNRCSISVQNTYDEKSCMFAEIGNDDVDNASFITADANLSCIPHYLCYLLYRRMNVMVGEFYDMPYAESEEEETYFFKRFTLYFIGHYLEEEERKTLRKEINELERIVDLQHQEKGIETIK